MIKPTFNRSAEPAEIVGRTLEGFAYRYEYPSRVTDDVWRSSYFEEMLRGCDTRTLRHRSSFPFVKLHTSAGGGEVGEVTFARSVDERALMFTATVARGRAGDELLDELDEWRDVSVTYQSLGRPRFRETPHHGRIHQRSEIKLVELAITPTGTGLAKGAEVLVHRGAVATTPRLDAAVARARRLNL